VSQSPDTESNTSSRSASRTIALTGISLLGVFLLFFLMGLTGAGSIAGLSTVDNTKILHDKEVPQDEVKQRGTLQFDPVTKAKPIKVFINAYDSTDTSKTKVFLFGDSELDHMRVPVYNYCKNNNCELVASVTWYGSTTVAWGKGDTLQKYLDKYKPDFVICILGLNELFIPNVEPRRESVQNIKNTVLASGAKFYWIGPAAWKKDQGICSMLEEELDSLCYPSEKLTLERASDKRHPSRDGSKVWFDSAAVAITAHTRLDLSKPVANYEQPKNSPSIIIPMSK
jgi:hypothetical protein